MSDNKVILDVILEVQGEKRETIREYLFKHITKLCEKRKSKKPQTDMNSISLPSTRFSMPKSLCRELFAGTNTINLNDDSVV